MKLLIAVSFNVIFMHVNGQNNLDSLLSDWHKDAKNASLENYFDFMNNEFVFMGTAPGERWNKTDFYHFCEPYFIKKSTWDFIPSNRNWEYNQDSTIAWFDEDLSTWMGSCRGSGVLVKTNGEWKIAFYNLCVLIENEKIKSFIRLKEKKTRNK
jgi:hypothetical protein